MEGDGLGIALGIVTEVSVLEWDGPRGLSREPAVSVVNEGGVDAAKLPDVRQSYDMPGMKDGIATFGAAKAAWFKDTEGNILAIVQGT